MTVYDYLVLGGGSGGIASARRAASYGAKVAIVEASGKFGGTCVNVGCVPKKVMWNTATMAESLWHHAPSYGFDMTSFPKPPSFGWNDLKAKRDAYIHRLNGIYEANLKKDGIDMFYGKASFLDPNRVQVTLKDYPNTEKIVLQAKHILIATGSHAWIPDIPGAKDHGNLITFASWIICILETFD